ncbi:MAG TPA: sugar ABC transporter ATP-binding protein [Candidatus Sumerlaeota bacterium]|nr:sugar ABC transporter ATP-binding protein [Candidatus Sumerlaeota bacterium]
MSAAVPSSPASSPAANPILRMQGIGKSFGGVRALHDVHLELLTGEVHILAGENGAGKSTLIKILAGVHRDYDGRIELDGRPVRFASPQDAAARGIAVIHQELSLIPSMSVADNIFLGRETVWTGALPWVMRRRQRRRAQQILDQLGLNVDAESTVERLPISLQQMIEIAKALAAEVRILVMDEPTSALTEPEVERLFALIAELKRRGVAIVYISHKMEEIHRIADRLTVLRDGRFVGTAPAAELPPPRLVQWMVGREIGEQFPRHTPHPGPVLLRVEELTLDDPHGLPLPVVDRVGFELRAGEIVGLGGLQGSGASDLLWGLFGARGRPRAGRIELHGRPYTPRSPGHAIRRGLALLTNDRKTTGLVLGMSITHNITLASLPRLSPGGWLRERREWAVAARLRERFDIRAADLDLEVQSLSGGNQQKIALAKWLEAGPRVLLLDEPTRGVDVGAKQEIYRLMDAWSAEGYAILLITSEMPELLALSDRILVLHRGRVTACFQRGEATQERVLQAAMGGTGEDAA